ncbi:MAG TPA: outer membrane beta-barrel protein [Stellaceae bacterium]|nr:outer membrane beta-barrel protein [Stellaceae bacterium]
MSLRFLNGAAAVALMAALAPVSPASAQQAAPADQSAAPAAPAAPTHFVWNGITISGHVDAGTNINPDSPDNNTNFGQLFTDRSNSFRMNQANIALEQDIDSSASTFNWGWRIEGMYGTDARFTHTIGLFDRATNSPYQWDLVEGSVSGHFPVVFSGGIDVKAGIYPTPIGYEVIDANGNFFYTHSYIFNFGIPLKHTGTYATAHVTDMIDVWAGVDTGVNAGVPFLRGSDNNKSGAVLAGFGINNPLPNLTILGLAHIGPENGYVEGASVTTGATAFYNGHDPNSSVRQIYDLVTTWKATDQITVVNETNYIRDDLFHATAEGTAFYGIYKWNDQWSFGARGEVFRDDQGFFVTAFQESQAFMNAERGIGMGNTVGPTNAFNSGYNAGKATYSELTVGANWAPAVAFPSQLPSTLGLTIRPEVRWDHAYGLNAGVHPFGVTKASAAAGTVGTKDDQILLSVDAIIAF